MLKSKSANARERERCDRAARGRVDACQSGEVNVDVGVAVHHERGWREEPFRPLQRAGGAEQRLAVARVVDSHAERGAVAERGFDLFRHVADAQHEVPGTAGAEQFELHREERALAHGRERLRAVRDRRTQPRAQPPAQHDYR